MITGTLPKRGTDDFGSGAFHASRGTYKGKPKKHKGRDYTCYPGTQIHSGVDGEFTKYGICYRTPAPGMPRFRYVQITDSKGAQHRYFYVQTHLSVGTKFKKGDYIGFAQDIARKYSRPDKTMKNHIHYEILVNGKEVDPEGYA